MGKRKNRQPDAIDEANGSNTRSSESSEEASIGESKCHHVQKSINLPTVRRMLKKNGVNTTCEACKSQNLNINKENDDEGFAAATSQLWICLKCGNQACGRQQGNHGEEHFKIPRSDTHCLAMDSIYLEIYCYKCDGYIKVDCQKHLSDIVIKMRNSSATSNISTRPVIVLPPIESIQLDTSITNDKLEKQQSLNHFPKVGGLINLGNTCFFNSVLQCLAQTPYLVKVLEDLREPGEKFLLPGGEIKVQSGNNDEIIEQTLAPIEGSLEGWGNFTSILCKTLIEMQDSSDNRSRRPSDLLDSFKRRTSQCMDGGQHDAHELLRHLLELVRNEDLKRYKSVILKETGLQNTSPRDAAPIVKALIKCYGNQVSARLLGPEPVFRGELVSTLTCSQCGHSSQRMEPFLDLSLPVMVDQPQPSITKRKSYDVEDNNLNAVNINVSSNPPLSKHQLKKEKKSARKNRKNRKQRNSTSNSNNDESLLSNNSIADINQESNGDGISEPDEESDADIENNIEGEAGPISDVIESGYSSEKTAHPSPTELMTVNPMNGPISKTFSEAETDECRSSPETEYPIRESSIMTNTPDNIDEISTELSKITVTNNKTLPSLSPRYPTVEGDSSIQSCLNQFTALELMTGSNKVGCESCTARENMKNQSNNINSKMICTNSTKQYLISRVPPVLILHLKRFQSTRYNIRKVQKHVTFPVILDLAPVCKNHNKSKLYSLFGLVEHTGHLHGGHYVAYVKARQPLSPHDRRWSFLPEKHANENDEDKSHNDSNTIDDEQNQHPETPIESPPGQWYCVSDSSVSMVDESRVLKREAYLLFYERII